MKPPLLRRRLPLRPRFNGPHFFSAFVLGAWLLPLFACAQPFAPDKIFARSVSGQFIVFGSPQTSPLARSLTVASDTNYVRLQPALLAISAERIKEALGRRLEIKPNTPWRGQIYLTIHPAQSLDENVTIVGKRLAGGWDYRVELPDVLSRARFMRALAGVLLLELANRDAKAHSAEVPAWLVDGLAEELAAGSPEFILSTPHKIVNGVPVTRINDTQHVVDSLTGAQKVLRGHPALTFEMLSWPTGAQQTGADGGVYNASAQLFASSLLELKGGPDKIRLMLESLPRFYNWQFAFQSAFHADFPRPVDVEKWWALLVAGFAVHASGPLWTMAASRARLDELFSIPVEARIASNNLPAHAEISLQTVIRSAAPERQDEILQATMRDLRLAQFRMAPPFAALAEGYRRVLAGYLGKRPAASSKKSGAARTLKKLDELDARRRTLEAAAPFENFVPPARFP